VTERSFKTDALVLLSRPLGEADRLVTFLSWDRGKFTAVARGARKTMSKLAAGVELFTYGHYQFYRGRNLATLTGQQVKEHFHYFRDHPELYPLGLYLAELAGSVVSGEGPAPEICNLLLEGWRRLIEQPDPQLFLRAFELKLLDFSGHCPHLNGCLQCGSAAASFFSPRQGGLLCGDCGHAADRFTVQPGTVALARRLLKAPLQQVKQIRPQGGQSHELGRLTGTFLRYHLDIGESRALSLLKLFK